MNNLLKNCTCAAMLAVVMLLATSMSPGTINDSFETTDVNKHFFTNYADLIELTDLTCIDSSPDSYVCGNWNLKYRRNCGSCSYQDQNGNNYNFRIVRYTKLCYYPHSPEFSWVIDTGDLCHEACY